MQKWILTGLFCVLGAASASAQGYEERVRKYIDQYKEMAVSEQLRSGIPAAITLAQGIHETSAGASELATEANNHFGIKCKKSWTGETFAHTDDEPDECFRKYPSAAQSYRDHSDYLVKTPRYAPLFTLSTTDYAAWAIQLKKCGYATNPRYAQVLIKLIEDYKLQEYTYAALEGSKGLDVVEAKGEVVPEEDSKGFSAQIAEVAEKVVPNPNSHVKVGEISDNAPADVPVTYPPYGDVVKVNGLKAVYARKGDIPLEYALKTNVRYERLLEINEINDKPLSKDMYLYLERKHSKGMRATHTVKEGESLADIAQYEGMQLRALRAMNVLAANDEPAPGAVLQLQVPVTVKPQIIATSEPVVSSVVGPQPVVVAAPAPVEVAPVETMIATPTPDPTAAVGNDGTMVPTQPALVASTEIGPAAPPEMPAVPTESASETPTVPNPPVNIANEKPVEEEIKEAKEKEAAAKKEAEKPQEPLDELDALKARFDKVVYAPKTEVAASVPSTPAASEPVAEPEVKKEEPVTIPATAAGAKFYTVKKGDTAFSIAKRNNITMRQLMDMNKLDFETIKVGQKLRVKP